MANDCPTANGTGALPQPTTATSIDAAVTHGRRRLEIMVSGDKRIARTLQYSRYSMMTRSPAPRPKVSGLYISSAFGGGTTKTPGVVAFATYV